MCSNCNKDGCLIKKVKKIIRRIVAGILLLYVCLIVLVNVPAIQHQLGSWIAGALSDKVGSEVSVGKVNIGMLNRLVVDDIDIKDKQGKPLLRIDRTAVNIRLLNLFRGKIDITSAQIFGLVANAYKLTPESTPNYQFLIDAFQSKDDDKESKIDLSISTFILRRGHLLYNVISEPTAESKIDANHLDIDNLNATVSLNKLTNESINASVRRFNFIERNSNLQLKDLKFKIECDNQHASIKDFNIKLPQSSLYANSIEAKYNDFETDKSYYFATNIEESFITPADLSSLLPQLKRLTTPLYFTCGLTGDQSNISISNLNLHSDDHSTDISVDINAKDINGSRTISSIIHNVKISSDDKNEYLTALMPDLHSDIINNIGSINYTGTFNQSSDMIEADGTLRTDVGDIEFNATYGNDKTVSGSFTSKGIDIGRLTADNTFGNASFDLNADLNLSGKGIPDGTIKGNIAGITLMDKSYSDVAVDMSASQGVIDGSIQSHDPSMNFTANATYDTNNSDVDLNLHVNNATIPNGSDHINLNDLDMTMSGAINGYKSIDIDADGIMAQIHGELTLGRIADAVKNQLAIHLPQIVSPTTPTNDNYSFDIFLEKSPLTKTFLPDNIELSEPVHILGNVNDRSDSINISVSVPSIESGSRTFINTNLNINGDARNLNIVATSNLEQGGDEDNPLTITALQLTADAHNNQVTSLLKWENEGMIYATTEFTDSLGKLHTDVNLHTSQFTINDTIWTIHPADLTYYDGKLKLNNINISNDIAEQASAQMLTLNGTISDESTDSVFAELKNIEIAYITDIVDFDAVKFRGLTSGKVTVASALDKEPHLSANIVVNDMHLQGGRLGTGFIQAFWDKERNGVSVLGHIIDDANSKSRITDVSGYIAPSTNDMDLRIDTHNTNAEFLNGFLSSTFSEISGDCNGTLHVIGPLNDVNLTGNISADVALRLRATGTRYHINPSDTLRLRPYQFRFEDIRLTDDRGIGIATVNGILGHKNMKNFTYDFNIGFNDITVYDEQEFNSDKFLATVYVNGDMELHGSDYHPLRMTANITPCKGSVFAYDAATPDAISSSNFVEIREKKTDEVFDDLSFGQDEQEENQEAPSAKSDKYTSDIYFDININVTPDCEIKLRMDNVEDGYMTTHGTGTLLARYHNKSPFTLMGTYNIQGGRYRMHLQDPIVRDLDIQPESKVEFNGHPFDADIRLLCHYTLNAVPLADITGSVAYNQNSKIKVVCVLDITGNLGNMEFGFDIQLPNVNDETRQLVRSLISSDEEMNMQMIYLLGLGRFYTNEYARASGETATTAGAVNTLLSSTISGQVNQMLSNVIGNNSKWNFGTGLSTGEDGWNDLDVEGILSGRLLNDRLLINGNFGYRDNALTNQTNFIGDFDVRWRLSPNGNTYIKAYNQTNDRYFTKATLNTQGIGITHQRDFDSWKELFRKKAKELNITK